MNLPDPPTRLQRSALTALHYFPGSTSTELASAIAVTEAQALSLIGVLLETRYVERDGLGGYLSTGVWRPEAHDHEVAPIDDLATPLTVARRLRAGWDTMNALGATPEAS